MFRNNYLSFAERTTVRVLRGKWGRRLVGTLHLLFSELAEGHRQAVRAPWIGDTVGPAADALGPAGQELSLPRYPLETDEQYETRLGRAWQDWPFAGDELTIIAQLAAAGWPGAQIYDPRHWPTAEPTGYWSQFWVFFPAGTHPVTSPGPLVGSFTVGDGTIIGPEGITPEQIYTLRAIVRKWKPGDWVCRGFYFEISGWTVGDGSVVGEPGLVIGGEQAFIGALT